MADQEDSLLESIKEEIASEAKAETNEDVKAETEQEEPKNEEVQEDKNEENDEKSDEEKDKDAAEKSSDEDSELGEQPKRRPSASDTIRALKEERKAVKAELEQIKQERAVRSAQEEFERRRQAEAHAAQSQRARDERLALLDPTERALFVAQEKQNELEYRLNVMHMQMQQSSDRSAFEAKMSNDPLYAKYGSEVEKLYQEGLKRGVTAPREELLNLVLGRELRKDAAKKLSSKKEAAGKRIDSVSSRPTSARSDGAVSKKGQTEEDRLRGVLI